MLMSGKGWFRGDEVEVQVGEEKGRRMTLKRRKRELAWVGRHFT